VKIIYFYDQLSIPNVHSSMVLFLFSVVPLIFVFIEVKMMQMCNSDSLSCIYSHRNTDQRTQKEALSYLLDMQKKSKPHWF